MAAGRASLWSGKDVGELRVPAGARPPERAAAVQVVEDQRVGAELEQGNDRLPLAGLRCEVDRGDTLTVARAAECAALIGIGAEVDERANGVDAAVDRRPRERRAAVRVGIDARAELDEQPDRLDAT